MENNSKTFFDNAHQFYKCRKQLQAEWAAMDEGLVCSSEHVPKIVDHIEVEEGKFNPDMRQHSHTTGTVATSLDELYETATLAAAVFEDEMNKLISSTNLPASYLHVAPLKGRARAAEKAADDYGKRDDGPGFSWLFDVVRFDPPLSFR